MVGPKERSALYAVVLDPDFNVLSCKRYDKPENTLSMIGERLVLLKFKIEVRRFVCVTCLLLFSVLALAQVEDFTKRLDEQIKTTIVSQAEQLLCSFDSISNHDSVLFFPLFLFRQDVSNMDKEKYLDYSFLDGLQWMALVPDKSIYPLIDG